MGLLFEYLFYLIRKIYNPSRKKELCTFVSDYLFYLLSNILVWKRCTRFLCISSVLFKLLNGMKNKMILLLFIWLNGDTLSLFSNCNLKSRTHLSLNILKKKIAILFDKRKHLATLDLQYSVSTLSFGLGENYTPG